MDLIRITFGDPSLSMEQIRDRLEKDNDLSFFSGARRSVGEKLSLAVFCFIPKLKQVWTFQKISGLPSVILFYQCCKFKTHQLSLAVFCFIPKLKQVWLFHKTKNHAKWRGFESVVMAEGFEPSTACLEGR
ncbi:hypothetical protein, partial [Arenibacter sp. 6A1]|uniref:hypothetical protein n=1 Tax=Arenibacter sp. 6A1 TaxID=2720391 RepID=UPI00197B5193